MDTDVAGDTSYPGLDLEPFGWYRTMREERPVTRERASGTWMIFRYTDVLRVLSDHEAFSSRFGNLSLINTDPPRHRQLRNLVTQAFTPRAVEALRPRIAEIADQLLDEVVPQGGMDLVRDFAIPLPVTVIAELLGIPIAERERFKLWSDAFVTGGSELSQAQASREMAAYFGDLLDERRRRPRADLISTLLAARIDGESLGPDDLLGFCVLLLIAGNETTTNLIGNAVLCLDHHPEMWDALRANPDLVPSTVEEVLRYRSPVQSMFRVVRSEVQLGGHRLAAGETVVAWIGSANRDPLQFPHPESFDIERSSNRHLAFGQGIHFCLGAPLARLEGTIALRALIRRLPGLAVDRSFPLERLRSQVVYGVRQLPVTFEPKPRVEAG